MSAEVFDTEVHTRLRDMNIANHVDSVEAIRIVDEARLQFIKFAEFEPAVGSRPGVLGAAPETVGDVVAGIQVNYFSEMYHVAFQPFSLRLWVSRIGNSSFELSTELRVHPDHDPALVARTSVVLIDRASRGPWPMNDEVRAALSRFTGEAVAIR